MTDRSLFIALGLLALTAACFNPGQGSFDDSASGDGSGSGNADDGNADDGNADDGNADDGNADSDSGSAACDETAPPSEDPCVVDQGLGVFVSPFGDDGGPGTRDAPVASLARAVELAAQSHGRVFACAEDLAEPTVRVSAPVVIFGGLDCAGEWSWIGDVKRTRLFSEGAAMQITGASTVTVEDIEFFGTAPPGPGSSVAAVVVHDTQVAFTRSRLRAGPGWDGVDANAGVPAAAAGGPGEEGAPTTVCLPSGSATTQSGGAAGNNSTCTASRGGGGGTGVSSGTPTPGQAGGPASHGGAGGLIASQGAAACAGADGQPGQTGDAGWPAAGIGALTLAGWVAPEAGPGSAGVDGGGGGGGGGGAAGLACATGQFSGHFIGSSGSGGGAGGCGGSAGEAGLSGGSSTALIAIDAEVVLTHVMLEAGDGGDGGAGAAGQTGGSGGPGGTVGCLGGTGGRGGDGGGGGGGVGGHSIGAAYVGPAPTVRQGVGYSLGNAGLPGPGGGPGLDGDAGQAANFLDFG